MKNVYIHTYIHTCIHTYIVYYCQACLCALFWRIYIYIYIYIYTYIYIYIGVPQVSSNRTQAYLQYPYNDYYEQLKYQLIVLVFSRDTYVRLSSTYIHKMSHTMEVSSNISWLCLSFQRICMCDCLTHIHTRDVTHNRGARMLIICMCSVCVMCRDLHVSLSYIYTHKMSRTSEDRECAFICVFDQCNAYAATRIVPENLYI